MWDLFEAQHVTGHNLNKSHNTQLSHDYGDPYTVMEDDKLWKVGI